MAVTIMRVALNTRIEEELKKALMEAAIADNRTVSALVELIVREHFKNKGK